MKFPIAFCCVLAALTPGTGAGQAYPDRPVKMIVPFSPGGGTDIIARLLGQKLNERWGKPVLVENKTGANGNIGAAFVAKSTADGYTLLVSSSAVTINPSLHDQVGYAQSDLAPVILLASSPFLVVVNPKLVQAATLKDFIAYAKSKAGDLAWASTSEGNAEHLAGSLLQSMGNFRMRHIPYKGGADALKDVVGGHVEVGVISLPTSLAYLQGGQLRAVASTDTRRAPQIPDVPTVAESGIPGFDLPTWYAVWAPAGTAPEIVDAIHGALAEALRSEEVQKRVLAMGFNTGGGPRAEFTDYVRRETDKYSKLIQSLGLQKKQ